MAKKAKSKNSSPKPDQSVSRFEKIAKNRGDEWRKKARAGRLEAKLKPSFIRLARLQKAFQQEDVAKKLGMSESTFGAVERAKRMVKADVAEQIAKLLSQPQNKLFKQAAKGKFVALVFSPKI